MSADLLEGLREGSDLRVGQVPGEVPVDAVSVVEAGAPTLKNYLAAVGSTKGALVQINLSASTDLTCACG